MAITREDAEQFLGKKLPQRTSQPQQQGSQLAQRVEQVESGGDPHAVSPKGALGPMQTMPGTLRDPGFGVRPAAPGRAQDPQEQRRVGQDYLQAMLQRYPGDKTRALAAYNWGPKHADRWDGRMETLPRETQDYVAKVLQGQENPTQETPSVARVTRDQAEQVLGRPIKRGALSEISFEREEEVTPSEDLGITGLFLRGVRGGGRNLRNEFQRTAAVLADVAGRGEDAQRLLEDAELFEQETRRRFGEDIEFDEAFDSARNFVRWLSFVTGEQVPVVASVIAGGGVGGLLGRAVAKGAINRGSANLAARFAQRAGAPIGAISTAAGIETGATAGEQFQVNQELEPGVALTAGIAKGMLEAVTPLALGRIANIIPRDAATRFAALAEEAVEGVAGKLARVGAQGLRIGTIEAATETLQESVDIAARKVVDEEFDTSGPEAKARLVESLVTGFFASLPFGALGGAMTRRRQVGEDRPAEAEQEDLPLAGDPGPTPQGPLLLPPPQDVSTEEVSPQDTGSLVGEGTGPPEVIITPPPPRPLEETFTENTPTVAIRNEQELNNPNLEFETGIEAKRRRAEMGEPEGDAFRSFAINEQASPELFTVGLRGLPNTVEEFEALAADPNSGISFINEQARNRAEREVRRAIMERNGALMGMLHGQEGARSQLQRASRRLRDAVRSGFRYRPQDMFDRPLVAVDKLPPEALTEVTALEGGIRGFLDTSNVTIPDFVESAPEGIIPLGNETAEVLLGSRRTREIGSEVANRTKKEGTSRVAVEFDLDRIPPERQFVASVRGLRAAFASELANTGNDRRALRNLQSAGFIEFPEVNFDTIVDNARNLFVPADVVREQAARDLIESGLRVRPNALPEGFNHEGHIAIEARADEFEQIANAINEVPLLPGTRPSTLRQHSTEVVLHAVRDMFGVGTRNAIVLEENRRVRDVVNVTAGIESGQIRTLVRAPERTPKEATSSARDRETIRLMQGALKTLRNMLRLKNHSFILAVNTGRPVNSSKGSYVGTTENVHVIAVNLRNIQEEGFKLNAVTTLAHEFGHAIVASEFNKLSSAVQHALIGAYNRALIRSTTQAGQEEFALPDRDLELPGQSPLQQEAQLSRFRIGSYWFTFDEWVAETMARWVVTRDLRGPLDPVEKFIDKITRLADRVFKTIWGRFRREDYNTPAAFDSFLNAIRERNEAIQGRAGAVSVYQPIVEENLAVKKSSKKLGVDHQPTAASDRIMAAANVVEKFTSTKDQAQNVRDAADGSEYFNWLAKYGFNVIQLANKGANKSIKWLQDYVALVRRWAAESNQWKVRANDTLWRWGQLGKEQADAVGRLLFDLDQMSYLKENEDPRQPTLEELNALFKEHKITEAGQQVYRQVRDDFNAVLREMEEVAVQDILKSGVERGSAAFLVQEAEIRADFRRLRNKPYFPHARFGPFMIVVRDPANKDAIVHVEAAESKREALNAQRFLNREFKGMRTAIDRVPEEATIFRGIPQTVLERLKNMPETSDTQRQWIDRMIVEMSPAQSFKRRWMRRQNLPGYSQDAGRAYAQYFWHGANHIARVKYGKEMERVLEKNAAVDINERQRQGINVDKRRQIQDFIKDHFTHIMNPRPDWAQLRSLAFTWWLGFSPASAALNITQIPMVAWPYMSARFKDDKGAMQALITAAKDINKMYTKPEALKDVSDDTLRLLDLGLKQGFLEESMAMELAAVAEGSALARARHGSSMQRQLRWFADKAAWMFQQSERFNRRIVFRAAVEMARNNPDAPYLQEMKQQLQTEFDNLTQEQGLSESEALAFLAGKDAVIATQFEYNAWARPRFMRGKAATVLTFFMFTQNMVWFSMFSPGNARFLLMMFAMAGLMGLPGAEDLSAVVTAVGRRVFGVNFDPEKEIRKLTAELFDNPAVSDGLLHGISRTGFGAGTMQAMTGWPLPVIDMSGSIGMGRVVPGLEAGAQAISGRARFDEALGAFGGDAAGASFGIFLDLFRFLNDSYLPIDDAKRWERAMPRSFRAVARATRVGLEGRERDRRRSTVLAFDTDDPQQLAELIFMAGGFQPTSLTRTWDRRNAQFEVLNYWRTRRTMLLNDFWWSVDRGDKEARKDVIDHVKRFNKDAPYPQMRITQDTLKRSLKDRLRVKRLKEAGLPVEKMYRPFKQQLDNIYPQPRHSQEEAGNGIVDVEVLRNR